MARNRRPITCSAVRTGSEIGGPAESSTSRIELADRDSNRLAVKEEPGDPEDPDGSDEADETDEPDDPDDPAGPNAFDRAVSGAFGKAKSVRSARAKCAGPDGVARR